MTAVDPSGNDVTATQTVTVVDNIDPTITAPAAVTVNCDAGACSAAATNVTLGSATTADNCSVASTTNDAPNSFLMNDYSDLDGNRCIGKNSYCDARRNGSR